MQHDASARAGVANAVSCSSCLMQQQQATGQAVVSSFAPVLDPGWLHHVCQSVLRDLEKYGLCVIDNLFASFGLPERAEALLHEVRSLYQDNVFRDGSVVNKCMSPTTIRSDQVFWVRDDEFPCVQTGFLLRALDTIVSQCISDPVNDLMRQCDIRTRTKAMIACYPGNRTHYVKHVDNPNRDGRMLTSLYYLNKDWQSERDGGLLRIFPSATDQVANIEPHFDRLVFFWSDRRNPHEVMESNSIRFAISVWYFNYSEREEELCRRPPTARTDFPLRPFTD